MAIRFEDKPAVPTGQAKKPDRAPAVAAGPEPEEDPLPDLLSGHPKPEPRSKPKGKRRS